MTSSLKKLRKISTQKELFNKAGISKLTWLTPNLRRGERERGRSAKGENEQDASDKVEPGHPGSTFQFCGSNERGSRSGNNKKLYRSICLPYCIPKEDHLNPNFCFNTSSFRLFIQGNLFTECRDKR
jgi:hypothetical protein